MKKQYIKPIQEVTKIALTAMLASSIPVGQGTRDENEGQLVREEEPTPWSSTMNDEW